ncbi:MAG: shikimate dehydrogenase [Bacillota bacterium]|nr:shikimate dehydrogenase [Bacillota bacterium]
MEKLYAVLGYPIGHSMSPFMHNDLFAFYNLEARYLPFQVKPEALEDAVKGLKAIGVSGFNVTVPHKSSIIPLLDNIDPLAMKIGAVNTVVNQNGKLIGYNTDGPGFLKSLHSLIPDVKDLNVLIIGAGGASRAIYYTMASAGARQIDICNRTLDKATLLIEGCSERVESRVLSAEKASEHLSDYDVIIQTSTVGMFPNTQVCPVRLENLSSRAIVCDIIYNPLETLFLQEAKQKGVKVQNGIDMFVYQGALAFELWTDIFPDIEVMRKNVLNQLGGNK